MTTVSSDFEIHTLPSGDTLAYRDRDHSYWREANGDKGSGRLLGVSTAAKALDMNPDPLISWGARLDREGTAALAAEGLGLDDANEMRAALSWLRSGETIGTALDESGLSWQRRRREAADRGTAVHRHALHALSAGEPVPAFTQLTDEERGYAQAVAGWWLEQEPDVICAEAVVADLEDGIAGRLDLLCRLRDGRVAVTDCKTGKFLASSWAAQLAGYRRLALMSGYPAAEVGVILQAQADGTFRHVEVALTDEMWTVALGAYRMHGEIAKQLRKAAA